MKEHTIEQEHATIDKMKLSGRVSHPLQSNLMGADEQPLAFSYQSLPDWMCNSEDYEPQADRDAFVTKSTSAVLQVLGKLKFHPGKEGRHAASPSLKICYTVLFILLTACSKNYLYTVLMATGTLVALACLPGKLLRQILRGVLGAVIFSALILLPSVFMGSPRTLFTITTKVFISVSLIGILSATTSWNKITRSLRSFAIPDLIIFTLDITLKYISVLGEICTEVLTSLKLRSVGKNKDKAGSLSGVLGITFLKSKEMSEELYAAMCCRGFTGEYRTYKTTDHHKATDESDDETIDYKDISKCENESTTKANKYFWNGFYLLLMVLSILLFIYLG